MDTTKKFSGIAEEYKKGRPGYPEELFGCLIEKYGFLPSHTIADIGSGTGKFSELLLKKGFKVMCVEPNDDMRSVAENELSSFPRFTSVAGNAENTGLSEKSIDFITVAQAFHWFDPVLFKEECKRLLKADGKVFLIWNSRDEEDEINRALSELYKRFCPAFNGFSGGTMAHDKRIRDFFNDSYEYFCFSNPLSYDREKFIYRSLSASYSLKEGDNNFEAYKKELSRIFDAFETEGVVKVGNNTTLYAGSVL